MPQTCFVHLIIADSFESQPVILIFIANLFVTYPALDKADQIATFACFVDAICFFVYLFFDIICFISFALFFLAVW